MNNNENIQDAAVLVPLYRGEKNELRIVLVHRTNKGIHGGEIALPGGKPHTHDNSLEDTAKREAFEETGMAVEGITILESLPSVETHKSGFRIFPFLATINPPRQWEKDTREIEAVLDMDFSILQCSDIHFQNNDNNVLSKESLAQLPFYQFDSFRIWGATYRILNNIIPRISDGDWEI